MSNGDAGSAIASLIACAVGLAVVGGLVMLVVWLIRASQAETQKTEAMFNQILQQLPQDKQMVFAMQYNNAKKSATVAVVLALFLGGLGIHRFYLGQTVWGVIYLLFFWTTVPAVLALIEAFFMAVSVSRRNQAKMTEIAVLLGAKPYSITASAAPQLSS